MAVIGRHRRCPGRTRMTQDAAIFIRREVMQERIELTTKMMELQGQIAHLEPLQGDGQDSVRVAVEL